MRKWTKTAGLLFLAAAAVYSDPATLADTVKPAKGAKPQPQKPAVTAPANDPFADVTPISAEAVENDAVEDVSAVTPDAAAGTDQPPQLDTTNVNVSDVGTVEIHVNDANLNEVLRMLSMQLQRNILPSKEVRGTVTANLYDVTVKEALDAILHANGYDYREKGNVIYVYSAKEIQELEKRNRVTRTQIFKLHYTPAANAANMIKPVLSTEAQVSFTTPAQSGIDSDSTNVGGDSHASEDILVVTDYPEKLEQAARVLKEIDRRPQQVLVEAVIMRATLNDENTLGIDFTAVGGVNFSALSDVGTAGTGSGLNQALSGQIVENSAAQDVVANEFAAGSLGGGGLKIGLVSNTVGLFIQALEGVTDTVVMANPKVLVLNKQKGEVHVGSEQGYRTTVTSEVLAAEDVKFLETGTRLIFRPYIGDNGFVRMEIKPEDSSGSVNAQGLPNKFVTQVTSNVMVRDGHTVVIGGLFRESSSSSKTQVPGLGSLPGVGPLFGRRTDASVREEVIILLTPHIVKDDDAYAAASEEELRQAERMRVGMRKGMLPWGRERLAEAAYEKASEEMAKANPDRKKALWHLDCATNLNPKFSEAIALKARITGQELASVDNSTIRDFVKRQVMAERLNPPATRPSDDSILLPAEREPQDDVDGDGDVDVKGAADVKSASAAAAPTTRPMTQPIAAAPVKTRANDGGGALSGVAGLFKSIASGSGNAPTTRPAATANVPTTRPTVAAKTPTTKPAVRTVSAPKTQPSTRPAAVAKAKPQVKGEDAPVTVVTELPVEVVE